MIILLVLQLVPMPTVLHCRARALEAQKRPLRQSIT